MKRFASLILLTAFAFAQKPGTTFKLAPRSPYGRSFTVLAADGDPSADTPQKIANHNRELAAAGNTLAAWELGLAYMQGDGIEHDLVQAEHWLTVGAVRPQEKGLLGELFEDGEYFPQDAAKADHWFRAAGRPGDLFALAEMYRKATPSQTESAAMLYRSLLEKTGSAEVRRAQLELGNLVLDGKYSSGSTLEAHTQDLAWARAITQELLGQVEYTIAVAYDAKVEDVPEDPAMWARFSRRAAAYDNDLAQQFYASALLGGKVRGGSPLEGAAWVRLSAQKRYQNKDVIAQLSSQMTAEQRAETDRIYEGLLRTREMDGAYYAAGDTLREPSAEALRTMADDDPDVQVRRAFALGATGNDHDYREALKLYRIARDRREMDIRVILGREYLLQQQPTSQSAWLAKHWFEMAARFGSKPAALYLARWYKGEGGGSPDPVQAYAWQWLGTELGPKPSPDELNAEQRKSAEQRHQAWRVQRQAW